jgi:hypothetical protein
MRRIASRLSYANVISTVCLFLVLGGGTAVALNGSNTVFSDDIVNGQVKPSDLAPLAFTAVKPNPQLASDPCPAEAGRFCGFVGSSGYRGWKNLGQNYAPAAYARDGLGMVRLQGTTLDSVAPHNPIFVLPPGYRPAAKREFPVAFGEDNTINSTESLATVWVLPNGWVQFNENEPGAGGSGYEGLSLEGIQFRCGPTGQGGCP